MDAVFYFNFFHQVYNFENGSHTVKTSIEFSKNSGKNSRRLLSLFQSLRINEVFNFNFFSEVYNFENGSQ